MGGIKLIARADFFEVLQCFNLDLEPRHNLTPTPRSSHQNDPIIHFVSETDLFEVRKRILSRPSMASQPKWFATKELSFCFRSPFVRSWYLMVRIYRPEIACSPYEHSFHFTLPRRNPCEHLRKRNSEFHFQSDLYCSHFQMIDRSPTSERV